MVKGATVANSPLLYGMILIGLGIIIVYAIMSVKKAAQRCEELGISKETIGNVVKATVTSAIVPSLAILLGFLTLTVSLGSAWPWWRLSVIGSLSYEVMASTYTANGIGAQLSSVLSSDATVFGAIMIVMSVGVVTGPLLIILFGKKYSTGIMKAKTGQSEWGQILAGCFYLALFAVYIPIMLFTDAPMALTWGVSFIVGIICTILARKAAWLTNFTMAIAMIIAMCSSIFWVQLFA